MKLLMIDGNKLKKFILAGANKLNKNKDKIDALNVFPVPDGDTGTNMSLTVLSAVKEISNTNSSNVQDIAKALSYGSLKGARGNSGVILSQLFRGFSKALDGKNIINTKDIALAFEKATESAYKAVMKPKEGTILTVAKALSEKATEMSKKTDDLKEMFKEVINYGNTILNKTMYMLPELKQAGVVDAGGKGLLNILEGAFFDSNKSISIDFNSNSNENQSISKANIQNTNIKYCYCTEFFINTKNNYSEFELKEFLQEMGDSIVVASEEDFIKIHIHTNNPGIILEKALKIGSLDNIKIENMKTQHTNLINFNEKKDEKEFGFISISIGDGLNSLFKDFGVDYVIEGGQTMNPSTQDILNAIEKVNAKNIFILPNNKNIILAAKQASEIYKNNDKNIIVLETSTIPQGYSALMNFLNTSSLDENIINMKKAIENTVSGQITFAVRETKIENFDIKENDFLAILEGKICNTCNSLKLAAQNLIDEIIEKNNDLSIICIYYGKDVSEESANEITNYIEEKYPNLDIELINGGQPLYYYIISGE